MTTASRKQASLSLLFLGILVAIVVVLNAIALFFDLGRVDLTENRLWSLSDGSKRIAADLEDQMEITGYFTENLPPPFNATERYVRDILSEYEAASGGKIRVRFLDPSDEETRKRAEEDGVRAVEHQVIENDAVSARMGFRGLVIRYLGDKKTIPLVQDASGLEYTVTTKIKELVGERTPIGLLSGHGGPTMSEGLSSLAGAMPTYDLKEVDATSAIDPKLAALLIVAPESEIPEPQLRNIDRYVMNGGSLGIFGGGMKVEINQMGPTPSPVTTGLNRLLERWGATIDDDLVADWQCSRAPMAGPMGLQVMVPYPAVPIVSVDDSQREHPALYRLNSVLMPFTSSISLAKTVGEQQVRVLAKTSENSWKLEGSSIDLRPRHPREWSTAGDSGPFPLIVTIEGAVPSAFAGLPVSTPDADPAAATTDVPVSDGSSRILVAGTGSFMLDQFLPRPGPDGSQDLSGALAFVLNAVDWLAQDSDLIAIRAKNVEDPPLEVPAAVIEAEDEARAAVEQQDRSGAEVALEKRKDALASWESKKSLYRWLNTLGLPLLFALFGVMRWRGRIAKKKNLKV